MNIYTNRDVLFCSNIFTHIARLFVFLYSLWLVETWIAVICVMRRVHVSLCSAQFVGDSTSTQGAKTTSICNQLLCASLCLYYCKNLDCSFPMCVDWVV